MRWRLLARAMAPSVASISRALLCDLPDSTSFFSREASVRPGTRSIPCFPRPSIHTCHVLVCFTVMQDKDNDTKHSRPVTANPVQRRSRSDPTSPTDVARALGDDVDVPENYHDDITNRWRRYRGEGLDGTSAGHGYKSRKADLVLGCLFRATSLRGRANRGTRPKIRLEHD